MSNLNFRAGTAALVFISALSGCSKGSSKQAAAVDQEPLDAAPAAPPVPTTLSGRSSLTKFSGDRLDECVDLTMVVPYEVGEDALRDMLTKASKTLGDDVMGIDDACERQFADRVSLATCDVAGDIELDAGVMRLTISSRYYNVKTTKDSDRRMKDCIKAGGKWAAVAHDDPRAARERLRQRAADLQNLSDKLTQP